MKFPDSVARTAWPLEQHHNAEGYVWEPFDADHVHYVPLGSLTPPAVDNLVAAGRCIDGDATALSSVRVMGPCIAMGAAAAHALDLAGRAACTRSIWRRCGSGCGERGDELGFVGEYRQAERTYSVVTNEQLYLVIGIPLLFNAALIGLLIALMNSKFSSVNTKFAALDVRFDAIDKRFDDMRDLGVPNSGAWKKSWTPGSSISNPAEPNSLLGPLEHNRGMRLTDDEKAMLDGAEGLAQQKAMELLVRYAEALGAENFVDTTNIAGVPGSSTLFLQDYFEEHRRRQLRSGFFTLRSG